jgi:hypothetical protein
MNEERPVRSVGFEPTALDLEGPCSILMSYERSPPGVYQPLSGYGNHVACQESVPP